MPYSLNSSRRTPSRLLTSISAAPDTFAFGPASDAEFNQLSVECRVSGSASPDTRHLHIGEDTSPTIFHWTTSMNTDDAH